MKIMRVYTRTGDKGTTALVGGVRINKTDIRLEAYGTVDELNSQIGLLIAMIEEQSGGPNPNPSPEGRGEAAVGASPSGGGLVGALIRIQNNLFIVGTHLATDQSQTPLYPSAILPQGETELLEQSIDSMNAQLPEKQGFVLPGGSVPAAQAHVCRTVCRRAERRIAALAETATVGPEIMQYINRLSDYLFILAKIINFNMGHSEIIWQSPCK